MKTRPSDSSYYIPHEWQQRIRSLPTPQQRACLAIYLITTYKARKATFPTPHGWKLDLSLDTLAFWPEHARPLFFCLHSHFLLRDRHYRKMVETRKAQRTVCTNGAGQNSNTPPSQHQLPSLVKFTHPSRSSLQWRQS